MNNTSTITSSSYTASTTGYAQISPYGMTISSKPVLSIDDIIEELKKRSIPTFTALKCRECGGNVEQKYMDPIVKCPYCGTVYIVGRKMINDGIS